MSIDALREMKETSLLDSLLCELRENKMLAYLQPLLLTYKDKLYL